MTEYVVIDDCGTTDNKTYRSLEAARAARVEILNTQGWAVADHVHVAELRYIPEPGAWKYEQDGVVFFGTAHDEEKINRLYDHGLLDSKPEWVPTYEWSL